VEEESQQSAAPPQSLEERVAYLEAQNEGLKRVGLLGLVLVMLLGVILVHQTYSDLRSSATRGLSLLNDKDEIAGAVTTDAQGRWQFLQARYGLLRPAEEIPSDFQGFAFYDSDGKPRFLMGEGKEKQTVFLVLDPVRGLAFDPFEKAGAPSKPPSGASSPPSSANPNTSVKPTPTANLTPSVGQSPAANSSPVRP